MKKTLLSAAAVLSLCLFGQANAKDTASIERGKAAAAVCAACHMADGMGMVVPNVEARPRIAGLNAEYFIKQIHAYQDGTRDNASMKPIVGILKPEQVKDLANYYESLPVTYTPAAQPSEEQAKLAQKLVLYGDWDRYIPSCVSCHGEGGYGVGGTFPNLNGQPAAYIEQTLNAWKAGKRNNDELDLMKSVAKRLTDDDIKALAAWFAAQPAVKATAKK